MEAKKIIMLFLDLEGTLITEETRYIKNESIESLLKSLTMLEENTGSVFNIHIVSPVFMKEMEKIVSDLDSIISSYNKANDTNLKEIQSAVAYPETHYVQGEDLYDKIFPMTYQKDDFGRYGKLDFVRKWIEVMANKIDFIIYGGNGLNDTAAMDYVKKTKKGFVICPNNSEEAVKKLADYISNQEEAEGIKDGIDFINEQIIKRKVAMKQNDGDEKPKGEEYER